MLLIGKFVYKSSQILFIFIFYYLIFLTICIIVCQYTINDFILVTEIDSLFNEKIMLKLDRLDKNDISTYNGYGWFNFREFNNFFEIFCHYF